MVFPSQKMKNGISFASLAEDVPEILRGRPKRMIDNFLTETPKYYSTINGMILSEKKSDNVVLSRANSDCLKQVTQKLDFAS
jgi:hypothetical protein